VLDHIVLAAPELAPRSRVHRADRCGADPGWANTSVGTANYLWSALTCGVPGADSAYLEGSSADPEQPAADLGPPVRIDDYRAPAGRLGDPPAIWTAAHRHGPRAGHDPGPPGRCPGAAAGRRAAALAADLGRLDAGVALVPFLIDRAPPRAAHRGLPEIELVGFEATHPRAGRGSPALVALAAELPLRAGNRPALTAVLAGRHGQVVLT